MTNNAANTSFEQSTLPFGTALSAESTGATNQRFTSYDRSTATSLDYAVNRSYSSGQGRFTSVDPIGMASASLGNPQSNNLYAYTENNPIDNIDPSGLDTLIHEGGHGLLPDGPIERVTVPIRFDDPIGDEDFVDWFMPGFISRRRPEYLLLPPLDPAQTGPIPPPTKQELTERLKHNNNDCENFLNAILKILKKKTTIQELLGSIDRVQLGTNLKAASRYPAEELYHGKIAQNDKPWVELETKYYSSDASINFSRQQSYMARTFHSLIHGAGFSDHQNQAEAVAKYLQGPGGKVPKSYSSQGDLGYSRYFDEELRKHCYTNDPKNYK